MASAVSKDANCGNNTMINTVNTKLGSGRGKGEEGGWEGRKENKQTEVAGAGKITMRHQWQRVQLASRQVLSAASLSPIGPRLFHKTYCGKCCPANLASLCLGLYTVSSHTHVIKRRYGEGKVEGGGGGGERVLFVSLFVELSVCLSVCLFVICYRCCQRG